MAALIYLLWPLAGLTFTVILLGMRDQSQGAWLAILPGMVMGPVVGVFVVRLWIRRHHVK